MEEVTGGLSAKHEMVKEANLRATTDGKYVKFELLTRCALCGENERSLGDYFLEIEDVEQAVKDAKSIQKSSKK